MAPPDVFKLPDNGKAIPNASNRSSMADEGDVPGRLSSSLFTFARISTDRRSKHQQTYEAEAGLIDACIHGGCSLGQVASQKFVMPYKARDLTCGPLAVAIGAGQLPLVERLIAKRVDIHDGGSYEGASGKNITVQPIHLAAAFGHITLIGHLLQEGADIEAKSLRDGRAHFTPLHDAVFCKQEKAVTYLLQNSADIDATNLDGSTALHLAAKSGDVELAHGLVSAGASLYIQDKSGHTPLMVAVRNAKFPHNKLHHLAERNFSTVMEVAAQSRMAASVLMKDDTDEGKTFVVHDDWRRIFTYEEQQNSVTVQNWLDLMKLAPEAGEDMLDLATVSPKIHDPLRYPLPNRASLGKHRMRTYYTSETCWRCDLSKETVIPAWHRCLAPSRNSVRWHSPDDSIETTGKEVNTFLRRTSTQLGLMESPTIHQSGHDSDAVEVHFSQVRLRGLVDSRVLRLLVATHGKNLTIFKKLTTQAILDYAWNHIAKYQYCSVVAVRVLDIVGLIVQVLFTEESTMLTRMAWSWTLVLALRESFRIFWTVLGFARMFGQSVNILLDFKIILGVVRECLTLCMCFSTSSSCRFLDWSPQVLCVVCYCRWFSLLYSLRCIPQFGLKILPMLHSFTNIGPMVTIALFVMLSFFHACLALRTKTEEDLDAEAKTSALLTFSQVYRLFAISDGEVIDPLLTITGDAPGDVKDLFAVAIVLGTTFIFCIYILNLFIVVLGEAYDIARDNAMPIFLQARASICLGGMLLPHWQFRTFGTRQPIGVALFVVASVVWFLLVYFKHPTLASLALVSCITIWDAVLLQRPWEREGETGDSHMLWICYRVDWDNELDDTDLQHDQGRLTGLRHEIDLNAKSVKHQLSSLHELVVRQDQAIREMQETLARALSGGAMKVQSEDSDVRRSSGRHSRSIGASTSVKEVNGIETYATVSLDICEVPTLPHQVE